MRPTTESSLCDKKTAKHWVKNIQKMLREVRVTPVSIHKIRYAIRAIKPDAYTPQYIGLGPYHRWREELYEMETCKLYVSAMGEQNHEKLAQVVKTFQEKYAARIRTSYDRHLAENEHSLAWMMVIDGIFLLQFLHQEHLYPKPAFLSRPKTARLVDRTQSAYHSILQDIIMLENQIPIFVLEALISYFDGIFDCSLRSMLLTTCNNLCPLKCHNENHLPWGEITRYAHLLELLYYLIVPRTNGTSSGDHCLSIDDTPTEPLASKTQHPRRRRYRFPRLNPPPLKFEALANIRLFHAITNSKPVKVLCKVIGYITPLIRSLLSMNPRQGGSSGGTSNDVNESIGSSGAAHSSDKEAAPKVDEIEIPSVTRLLRAGIKIRPTYDKYVSITDCIYFDKMDQTLYLPEVTINANTEVIIRNLVAYEAEAISGPSVLARYTELMNGIIDTANDVRLLRDRKIIVSYLKSDEDVAELWNGMSRSIRLSRVPSMDTAIKDVNHNFNRKGRVRLAKFTKCCVFCGWRILMLLLVLVFIVFMAVQSFCEVYRCPLALEPVVALPPVP